MLRARPGPGALSPGAPPSEVGTRQVRRREVGWTRPASSSGAALAAVTSNTAGAASDTPPPDQQLLLLLFLPLTSSSSLPPGRSDRRVGSPHTLPDAPSGQLLSWQGGLGLCLCFLLTAGFAFSHCI